MRRRNSSKASVVSNSSGSRLAGDLNVATMNETFTFPNGDKYEGEYATSGEREFLVRQGRGIYDTDDFNRYEAIWERDKIASDLHIRFNNEMEYKGESDKDGCMSGWGTYRFPDGSSIEAIWKNNKPVIDIRYKEPLGYIWKGQLSEDGNTVEFTAGNHFWDDAFVSQRFKSKDQPLTEFSEPSKASESSELHVPRENLSLEKNLK